MIEPSELPWRLTTRQAAEAQGISVATFLRRRRRGVVRIEPVDRGVELLWAREDVWRLVGYAPPAQRPEDETRGATVSPDRIREARAAMSQRGRPRRSPISSP